MTNIKKPAKPAAAKAATKPATRTAAKTNSSPAPAPASQQSMPAPAPALQTPEQTESIIVQNILPGPLFISDIGMEFGGHEVKDLTWEDPSIVKRSQDLRRVFPNKNGMVLWWQKLRKREQRHNELALAELETSM
jgi:hypothetical protein